VEGAGFAAGFLGAGLFAAAFFAADFFGAVFFGAAFFGAVLFFGAAFFLAAFFGADFFFTPDRFITFLFSAADFFAFLVLDFFPFFLRAAMMILLTVHRATILRRSRTVEKPQRPRPTCILRMRRDSS